MLAEHTDRARFTASGLQAAAGAAAAPPAGSTVMSFRGEGTVQVLEAAAGAGGGGADGEEVLPRFRIVGNTGARMHIGGRYFPVVLDMSGGKFAAQDMPVLQHHDVREIVGQSESVGIENGELIFTVVASGVGRAADEVRTLAKRKFKWKASIGWRVLVEEFVKHGASVKVNGRTEHGPCYVHRQWSVEEVSFVPIAADANTSVKQAATGQEVPIMTFSEWLAAGGWTESALTASQRTTLEAAFNAERATAAAAAAGSGAPAGGAPAATEPGATPATSTATAASGTPDDPFNLQAQRNAHAAEVERIASINTLCGSRHPTIQASAIREGWTRDRTELEVMRASRPAADVAPTPNTGPARSLVWAAALCMTAGMAQSAVAAQFGAAATDAATAREYQGAGLQEFIYASLQASGENFRAGRMNNDTIRQALYADQNARRHQASASAQFSTVSLSGVLGNVANKAMLAQYEAVASTYQMFCAQESLTDFKQHTKYRITMADIFKQVGATGELQHTTLTDASYVNQLDTYGLMISLTRQMIINDDLGAFLQIPRMIGRGAALRLEQSVFELIIANTGSFFHADNANYFEGAATNLQISSLTTAEQKFLDQTDSAGNPILITPKVLIVPTALKTTAEVLMSEAKIDAANNQPNRNPHVGKFKIGASPYLSSLNGGSSTAWYLFSDPGDNAAFEVGFLRGQRRPTIESSDTDFDTLGMRWRGFFDFGVAQRDHRAGVKSKGAA